MIKVAITEQMKRRARNMSRLVMQRKPNRPNYTGLDYTDRYYVGYLGELVFAELLRTHHKQATYNITLSGESALEDFLCTFQKSDRQIDIKTTAHPRGRYFLLSKEQHNIYPDYIYVGVKIAGDTGEVWGWSFFKDLEYKADGFSKECKPTYFKELHKMNRIEPLVERMRDGFVTEHFI